MVFTLRPSAHLGSLATGHDLGTTSRSSGIARFVKGGVVKTFRRANVFLVLALLPIDLPLNEATNGSESAIGVATSVRLPRQRVKGEALAGGTRELVSPETAGGHWPLLPQQAAAD